MTNDPKGAWSGPRDASSALKYQHQWPWLTLIPHLHDTTGWMFVYTTQSRLTIGWTFDNRVERTTTVRSTGCQTRLYNWFDKPAVACIHDTTGCQTGLTTGLTNRLSDVVVSCKRGLKVTLAVWKYFSAWLPCLENYTICLHVNRSSIVYVTGSLYTKLKDFSRSRQSLQKW